MTGKKRPGRATPILLALNAAKPFGSSPLERLLTLIGTVITHYQIGEEALQKLAAVFQQVAQDSTEGGQSAKISAKGIYGQ
jgi:hypothetical protein